MAEVIKAPIDKFAVISVEYPANTNVFIAPLQVQLSALVLGAVAPLSYNWNFGDGSANSTQPAPTHIYSTPGTYQISLVITDAVNSKINAGFSLSVIPALGLAAIGISSFDGVSETDSFVQTYAYPYTDENANNRSESIVFWALPNFQDESDGTRNELVYIGANFIGSEENANNRSESLFSNQWGIIDNDDKNNRAESVAITNH